MQAGVAEGKKVVATCYAVGGSSRVSNADIMSTGPGDEGTGRHAYMFMTGSHLESEVEWIALNCAQLVLVLINVHGTIKLIPVCFSKT
eukprot:1151392-Pelagomonas_calceolata.AAC.3